MHSLFREDLLSLPQSMLNLFWFKMATGLVHSVTRTIASYLLFCLVQLHCDVSLESYTLSIVEHPKTCDNNGVKDFEMYTNNSVFRKQ